MVRIGLVGGGSFCSEFITNVYSYGDQYTNGARIVAVADPDTQSPGVRLARDMGLKTVTDHHDLYDPAYDINLLICMRRDDALFEDVLKTKPEDIRLLSHQVFCLLWNTVKLHEKALEERTEELTTIVDGIQDFILVITPERKIVEANKSFLEQMGYSREDVVGRSCHEVFQNVSTPCESGDIVCPLNEVIRNKRPSQQVLTRVNHDGGQRYFEVSIFPIWEKDGKISRFIEVSRDITKRKNQEEEITRRLEAMVEERTRQLEESHAKVLHQDKMASLGKLSASVVHEINNPIAGILNLIMLLKRIMEEQTLDEPQIEQFKHYIELMETETRRIGRIVSNLLAFSRQSKVKPEAVNLNQVIERSLFLNANLMKIRGIKTDTHLDPQLPDIMGSEDQIQQIFMNLISNAAEAMESSKDGELRIETRVSNNGSEIRAQVRDTGAGISKAHLSKLFEPFFTTKKKGKGVGLGLSVVYGIIKEHGGAIHVASEVGEGTTFTVTFPLNGVSS
jgi:PAS domain S-box-containing protein